MRSAPRAGAAPGHEPARRERAKAAAPSRAAHRLRRLALHALPRTERSRAGTAACAWQSAAAAGACLQAARGAGRDDRLSMAARALSEMLCAAPSAARCHAAVRPGGTLQLPGLS